MIQHMNTPLFPTDSGANATAADLEHVMLAQANPADAEILQRFFKTGPGQYGEGDRFLGCKNPVTRRTAKAFRDLPVREAVRAAHSEWHEVRLCALLILLGRYESKKTGEKERATIFKHYAELARHGYVNNWDLVDLTAPGITGAYAFEHGADTLERFAASGHLWEERIAVLSMFPFIRANQLEIPFRMVDRFLPHPHDLMHKSCGWMLREIGKRDRAALTAYLEKNKASMSRTTLRYAIEHYPESERKAFLSK
jgi:3-methyladenine DNA glycosylase AlkD